MEHSLSDSTAFRQSLGPLWRYFGLHSCVGPTGCGSLGGRRVRWWCRASRRRSARSLRAGGGRFRWQGARRKGWVRAGFRLGPAAGGITAASRRQDGWIQLARRPGLPDAATRGAVHRDDGRATRSISPLSPPAVRVRADASQRFTGLWRLFCLRTALLWGSFMRLGIGSYMLETSLDSKHGGVIDELFPVREIRLRRPDAAGRGQILCGRSNV
jgi:hypothetical protein